MKRFLTIFLLAAAITLTTVLAIFAETPVLMMATTTNTDNSRLLDELAPAFQETTGIELRLTAVGTGKAL